MENERHCLCGTRIYIGYGPRQCDECSTSSCIDCTRAGKRTVIDFGDSGDYCVPCATKYFCCDAENELADQRKEDIKLEQQRIAGIEAHECGNGHCPEHSLMAVWS